MKHLIFNGIEMVDVKKELFYTINPVAQNQEGKYYFLSNDALNIDFSRKYSCPITFIGVANPHSFHVLALIVEKYAIKRIIMIDNNIEQLSHFRKIVDIIHSSSDRIDYIQNLLKVRFNKKAVKILNSFRRLLFRDRKYIHGSFREDGYSEIEKRLWENLIFKRDEFIDTYHLNAEKTEKGLLIKSKTLAGGFGEYYATFICASRKDYDRIPFNAGYGFGFLRDNRIFQVLKNNIRNCPIDLILGNITGEYSKLIASNAYSPIILWLSNLASEYFVENMPDVKKLLQHLNSDRQQCPVSDYPETDINIVRDRRDTPEISDFKNANPAQKEYSIHYLSFQKVSNYLKGNKCLEVVSVKRWIEKDKGNSKLYNTEYMLTDDFRKDTCCGQYSTVFIHILLGHGMNFQDYRKILLKASSVTDNLIILENNIKSRDFRCCRQGCSVEDVRGILGKEDILEFCPGKKIKDRNILMIYRNSKKNNLRR